MTAEVAVYNRSAISLAADSAASINGENSNKVFNNAEKLFALTKKHPIGIMIHGSSQLSGVPWEIIIKQYRKECQNDCYDKLTDYANNFFNFTQQFYNQISTQLSEFERNSSIELSCINSIEKIADLSTDFTDDGHTLDEAFLKAALLLLDVTSSIELFDNFDESDTIILSDEISEFVTSLLDEYELNLDSECYESVLKYCSEQALKPDPFTFDFTGVVFAGYGDKEFFPSTFSFDVHGMSLGKLKKSYNERNSVSDGSSAGLIAFAQRAEVESFMQGICNSTAIKYEELFESYRNSIKEAVEPIIAKIPDKKVRKEVEKEFTRAEITKCRQLNNKFQTYVQREHVNKVVEMIEHLPKNELAYMAESLVNLTAFKRKVSNGLDSVGGPIDVAVISKGEGFVWIKRKHYFPGELNKDYKP
ncbi:hypothetical protein L4C36_22685 [Photobacterium japonica]|uniref:hypothetical protein n=1 Tax=Photobacterium japonica TaxID=2910235 RepID=UPI003D0D120E